MKTKDVLIGIVLGMMIAGAIAQTSLKLEPYTIEADKEKVDYLASADGKASGTQYLTEKIDGIVQQEYTSKKRDYLASRVADAIVGGADIDKIIACVEKETPTTTTTIPPKDEEIIPTPIL